MRAFVGVSLSILAAVSLACGRSTPDDGGSGGAGGAGNGAAGGGGGNGAAGAGGIGDGQMTWLEDGVRRVAVFASATRVVTASIDILDVVGANGAGAGVVFTLGAAPPLVAGVHTCPASGTGIGVTLRTGGDNGVATDCVIELSGIGDATGDRATGAFRANVSTAFGGTKTIAEGLFDLSLVVNVTAP